jgi:hypothetical protein
MDSILETTATTVLQFIRQAGALAYVFKLRAQEDLILAVKSALQDKPFVSPSIEGST